MKILLYTIGAVIIVISIHSMVQSYFLFHSEQIMRAWKIEMMRQE